MGGLRSELVADLRGLQHRIEFTRDRVGEPGCAVRRQAADDVEVLSEAIAALDPAVIGRVRDLALEEAARAAEGFEDPSRDWLRRSVWGEIKCDTAARIRKLIGTSA